MKKKKRINIFLCIVICLFLVGFVYKKFSTPKFKDLDSSWGLGTKLTKSVSNNKDYDWYVDQYATGRNAIKNCGPSVVAMVANWQDEKLNLKVNDIVDKYIPDESLYAGADFLTLYNWMEDYKLNPTWLKNATIDSMIKEIDKGNILLIGVDLQFLKYNSSLIERVGKPWDAMGSHYVIIKGYKEVDGKLYFEVYDPVSSYRKYNDGQLIGKDRYYDTEELMSAIKVYYTDVIIVSPKTAKS